MSLFLWLKALHIVAVIAWMAGLLYLPRLFVYHAAAGPGSELSETFRVMERRLYRAIMLPAMIAVWTLGAGMLALDPSILMGGWWMWLKLALVVVLSGIHGLLGRQLRAFATDGNEKSPTYFRILNEIPTLLMVAIVLLVVLKPF